MASQYPNSTPPIQLGTCEETRRRLQSSNLGTQSTPLGDLSESGWMKLAAKLSTSTMHEYETRLSVAGNSGG